MHTHTHTYLDLMLFVDRGVAVPRMRRKRLAHLSIIVCCSVLQCVLQCAAVCIESHGARTITSANTHHALQHTAVHCNITLQHTATAKALAQSQRQYPSLLFCAHIY